MTVHQRGARCAALVALLAAALVAEGCAGAEPPAGPSAVGCPTAAVLLCTDHAHALRVRSAVADAADRLAPALESARARTALTERLAILSVELDVGDIGRARQSLNVIQAVLATARAEIRPDADDAADLEAIALTIQETASALRAP